MATLRYLTDETGQKTDVVIPMTLWYEWFPNGFNGFNGIEEDFDAEFDDEEDDGLSETERIRTDSVVYQRLLDSAERAERGEGIPYEVVREKLDI